MRIVQGPDDFVDSVLSAQREAAASFGIDTLLIEKYITQPRHIEVQVIFRFQSFHNPSLNPHRSSLV
jgi:acetyl/propionyl-CoA carboxylase alpha subunit